MLSMQNAQHASKTRFENCIMPSKRHLNDKRMFGFAFFHGEKKLAVDCICPKMVRIVDRSKSKVKIKSMDVICAFSVHNNKLKT